MSSFPDIIILAGGFGTRLQDVIKDVPKPMAPVAGKPFLDWLLLHISQFNPNKIILSTGYMHEVIESNYGNAYDMIPIVYSVETEPLGTGGAIKKALELVETKNCLVLNGDTFLKLDYSKLVAFHDSQSLTMVLKLMKNPDRYGTVEFKNNVVSRFNEKTLGLSEGYINTGVYMLNETMYSRFPNIEKFSFETDFLEPITKEIEIRGFESKDYFIDIGIPEDFNKANHEFKSIFNTP